MVRAHYLLALGANVDHAFVGDECLRGQMHEHLCWPGNTPLAEAIRRGNANMIRALVGHGAKPNGPVAAAFGTYPGRVKDRPLTWWMRFAIEYEIDQAGGQGKAFIQPKMEPAGCMLLCLGADTELGAITHDGGEGISMGAMMIREGLGEDLERMRAKASQGSLGEGTVRAAETEQGVSRL